MKIAIMAGTPIDTQMGAALIDDLDAELILAPVSKNPSEQTFFQTQPYEKREAFLRKKLAELIQQGTDLLLVYCNSLSGSFDFDRLSEEFALPIITPFQIYREIAPDYERIGVLAANAQGAAGIEKVLVQTNPTAEVYSITNLSWVKAVENQRPPKEIVEDFGLLETTDYFKKNKVEAILIGCTHFPYFLQEYQETTPILCINPDTLLHEKITAFVPR